MDGFERLDPRVDTGTHYLLQIIAFTLNFTSQSLSSRWIIVPLDSYIKFWLNKRLLNAIASILFDGIKLVNIWICFSALFWSLQIHTDFRLFLLRHRQESNFLGPLICRLDTFPLCIELADWWHWQSRSPDLQLWFTRSYDTTEALWIIPIAKSWQSIKCFKLSFT